MRAFLALAALALSACAKQPPPLPTTCTDAQRERTVSMLVCSKGCSREEAERYVAIKGLAGDICAREQAAAKQRDEQRDEQLRREADQRFEDEWLKKHAH